MRDVRWDEIEKDFVDLHVHTKYSLGDAIIEPEELVLKNKQAGRTAVATTEHGNVYSAIEAYKLCKENGMKYILGNEMYITEDSLVKDPNNRYYHLIVLAKNEVGRRNLNHLTAISSHPDRKYYGKPRIDFELLSKYGDGLIISSACLGGEIMKAIEHEIKSTTVHLQINDIETKVDKQRKSEWELLESEGILWKYDEYNNNIYYLIKDWTKLQDIEELANKNTINVVASMPQELSRVSELSFSKAKEIALKYKSRFRDDFYLEIQAHNTPMQRIQNRVMCEIGDELGIPYIITTDSHYLNEDDSDIHEMWVLISEARETGEVYNGCHWQSVRDMYKVCDTITDEQFFKAVSNVKEIKDKCNIEIPLSDPIMPHVEYDGYESEFDKLKHLVAKGWIEKDIENSTVAPVETYKERLQYEMDAIKRLGFEGYFLFTQDYANRTKRRSPGRGSGASSLVNYLLDITKVDPLKYNLLFERFIDVGQLEQLENGDITRSELKIPDIDIDFSPHEREEIVQYLKDVHGTENVVAIGIFSYVWAKGAVKDIARVLGIDYDEVNEITKTFGDLSIKEVIEAGLLDGYKESHPELLYYAEHIAGLPKSFGQHPCGYIVTEEPAHHYQALEYGESDVMVVQGDMRMTSDLGLIKSDILGLRTLDVIYDILDMEGVSYDIVEPHNMDMQRKDVLDEFAKGNTAGVFQFESEGMQDTLRQMQVSDFENLAIANALYRPGSMDFIPDYVDRRSGKVDFEYLHPDLEPILKETYGIIVFQEQLIHIGRMAGLRNPDLLREATGKKKPEVMDRVKPELFARLRERGWAEETMNELWAIMLRFADYSFNKAHATAYAQLAYTLMMLKVDYPTAFIASWMNSYNGEIDKMAEINEEAKRMGITIKVPKYTDIKGLTYAKNGEVYIGTASIKGLSESDGDELHELVKDRKYEDFVELYLDISNNTKLGKSRIESLVRLGVFRDFGNSNKLLQIIDMIGKYYERKQISKAQVSKSPFTRSEIEKYCSRETTKTYMEVDFPALIQMKSKEIKGGEQNYAELLMSELDLLGYPKITIPELPANVCLAIDVFTNKFGKSYITAYRISDGQILNYSLHKNTHPKVKKGQAFQVIEFQKKPQVRKIEDKWVELETTENWIIMLKTFN